MEKEYHNKIIFFALRIQQYLQLEYFVPRRECLALIGRYMSGKEFGKWL